MVNFLVHSPYYPGHGASTSGESQRQLPNSAFNSMTMTPRKLIERPAQSAEFEDLGNTYCVLLITAFLLVNFDL
jgi:hypothetical protein